MIRGGEGTPRRKPRRRSAWRRILPLALALLFGLVSLTPSGYLIEEQVGLPGLFRLRGERPVPPEAMIVRLDRASLKAFSALEPDVATWPPVLQRCQEKLGGLAGIERPRDLSSLPRGVHACIIDELARQGAAGVVFDVSFRPRDAESTGTMAMANAMAAFPRVVLLQKAVQEWLPSASGGQYTETPVIELADQRLIRHAAAVGSFTLPRDAQYPMRFWVKRDKLPLPWQLPSLALWLHALDRLGPVPEDMPGAGLPGLGPELDSAIAAWTAGGGSEDSLPGIVRNSIEPPTVRFLNFFGPPQTLPSIGVAELLGIDPLPPDAPSPEGRIVFVGHMDLRTPAALDVFGAVFPHPLGLSMSGVEIGATAFLNLLHGNTLHVPFEGLRGAISGVVVFLLMFGATRRPLWLGTSLVLGFALAYGLAVLLLFMFADVWLPFVLPLLVAAPLAVLITWIGGYSLAANWLRTYLPSPVARHLLEDEDAKALSRRAAHVTIMFTDITGFTSGAERQTPETTGDFVESVFEHFRDAVESEGGVLHQLTGDGIIAYWGAPDPQADHAARACRAALHIARLMEGFDAEIARRWGSVPHIRIGLNSGTVVTGNVGRGGHQVFGLMGDTVNLTQRIEQLAKTLASDEERVTILASQATVDAAGPGFVTRHLGAYKVKNRRQPVVVHRVIGEA